MKKRNWLTLLGLCLLVVISVIVTGCGSKEPAESISPDVKKADPVVLKMVTYSPTNLPETEIPKFFIDKVNKELAGKVKIELVGGPEIVAQPDQAEAVRSGTIDMVLAPAAMFVSILPEADALKLATITGMDERKSGSYDLFNKLFAEKANLKYMWVWSSTPDKFFLYTNEKIDKADLSGMTIRSIPLYEPIIKKLGGKGVSVSLDELHVAMNRKVIDAFFQPVTGGHSLGFPEIAKYIIRPGFYRAEKIIVMNQDSWKKLPKDVQEAMTKISIEAEQFAYDWDAQFTKESADAMVKAGMEFIDLPAAEAQKFAEVAAEEGWAKVKQRAPGSYDKLREVLTKK